MELLIGVFFTLVGAGLLLSTWRGNRQLRRWTQAEGRIVDTLYSGVRNDEDVYVAQVVFATADGQHVQGWAPDVFSDSIQRKVGGPISVWYCPGDPERFRARRGENPRDRWYLYAFWLLFLVVGLAVLVHASA